MKIESLKTVTPNMWTNLQIRRLTQKPKNGKRDEFWDGKGDNSKVAKISFVPKIMNLLEEYNFLNRIIDGIGYGDSFVLTLSKL